LKKWLAPLGILVGLEGAARADLPPAPWHLGQTQTRDPVALEPPEKSAFSIDSTTPLVLPFHGGNAGSPFALTCGPDELVTGVWGRAENTLDTLGLYCSRIRPNGTLQMGEQRPALGTAMTTPFTLQCPVQQAVMAVRGRAGTKLDRVGLSCARIRPWLEQGIRGVVLQSVGGAGGSAFADECPAGYFFQGIFGYSNGTINGAQGLCAPIVSSH
jgi:hypothetical protein